MGRRLVGAWAALVYVFLYAPIVVVVVFIYSRMASREEAYGG